MAAHNVICYYCNQVFDTKTEAYVMVNSRRYAHKTCHDRIQANKPQEEKIMKLYFNISNKNFN